ncbi:HotDog domain-containing protein [Halteromyces radiatus]|uniref:HotDog domain-containing protein n=1 Tax=Halteromyces radiatus TaxID=101107 RepID=UPI0022204DB2|nr:HotDog domain-containing protein [Halteromyces radiatus]KAI8100018.1 HotDog domain-containing protein [Halteromyces radiatus]
MKIDPSLVGKYPDLDDYVRLYARRQGNVEFWEDYISPYLTIIFADKDKLIWEFDVHDNHCNQLGNLHGGCVATLIDVCSSFATLVHEGTNRWDMIGVSTDLGVSYMNGVSSGNRIRLECEVQKLGKTLGYIYTKVYDEDNRICYSGSHTKYTISRKSNL